MKKRVIVGRKLLVATAGVATITFIACSSDDMSGAGVANVAPPLDAGVTHSDAGDANIAPPSDSGMKDDGSQTDAADGAPQMDDAGDAGGDADGS